MLEAATHTQKKRDIVDCHPFSTALTDDFLSHYVMELRASPALAWPVAFVHTPGYERTGNWPVGCWVSTLGIYIGGGGKMVLEGVHVYSTSIQISFYVQNP